MAVASHRRWFRFSQRGLLVLVALASVPLGWLSWQVHIVRQREAAVEWIEAHGGAAAHSYDDEKPQIPSFWEKALGDRPIGVIALEARATTEADVARISRSFPEARIIRERYPLPREDVVPTPVTQSTTSDFND